MTTRGQPHRAPRVGRLVALITTGVLIVIFVGSCADWVVQGNRVRRASDLLVVEFPLGMPEIDAQQIAVTKYPEHTRYSAADCEKWSHLTTPRFRGAVGLACLAS